MKYCKTQQLVIADEASKQLALALTTVKMRDKRILKEVKHIE